MIVIRALLLSAVWSSVWATTIPTLSVEQLFKHADTVAIVTITEGHMLREGNTVCGATYHATVEQLFKGTKVESIEFGPFTGAAIGGEYLIFLTAADNDFSPVTSTTASLAAADAEYRERCIKQRTANHIMHSGEGLMEIRGSRILFFPDAVKFPEALKHISAMFGDCVNADDARKMSVRRSDVVQLLMQLGGGN